MTLIECFDPSFLNNVAGCLHLRPEKLIMLGDMEDMEPISKRFRYFLKQRNLNTKLVLCPVAGNDMAAIADKLNDIVRSEEKCVIDLSGGDETVIMAVGAMLVGLDSSLRKRVSVQKFDPFTGDATDCDGDRNTIPGHPASLSVQELIALNGGTVYPELFAQAENCSARDLDPLWSIVSADPRDWNRKIMVLSEFESRADSKTQVFLPLRYLRGGITNFDEKESLMRDLLSEFDRRGVIVDRSSGSNFNYTYTSPLMRYCTLKAGNVLEMKVLLEARSLRVDGRRFFTDCQMGVGIDWDGIIHKPAEHIPETRNEIDLILTRGLVPLFISCKNGDTDENELYKLNTVATRFGGPFARKMLIATNLDGKNPTASRSFIQRAKDMNIALVADASELTRGEWEEVLKSAMG